MLVVGLDIHPGAFVVLDFELIRVEIDNDEHSFVLKHYSADNVRARIVVGRIDLGLLRDGILDGVVRLKEGDDVLLLQEVYFDFLAHVHVEGVFATLVGHRHDHVVVSHQDVFARAAVEFVNVTVEGLEMILTPGGAFVVWFTIHAFRRYPGPVPLACSEMQREKKISRSWFFVRIISFLDYLSLRRFPRML